jgi:hypothetical protein
MISVHHCPKWFFCISWSLAPEKNGDAIGLKLKRGTAIVDREQRWLVPDFLPDDTLIVVAGQVGLGKTTACMDWAASITNCPNPLASGPSAMGVTPDKRVCR